MKYAPTGTNLQATYVTVLKNRNKITELSTQTVSYFQTMVNPFSIPLLRVFLGKNKLEKLLSYTSLHAVTLGLGTCFNGFITRAINSNKKIKNSLNIPKENRVYSTLLVRYLELNYKKRVIRDELIVDIIS